MGNLLATLADLRYFGIPPGSVTDKSKLEVALTNPRNFPHKAQEIRVGVAFGTAVGIHDSYCKLWHDMGMCQEIYS